MANSKTGLDESSEGISKLEADHTTTAISDYERGRDRFLTGGILSRDEARNKEMKRGWNEAFDEEQAEREKRRVPGAVPHVFRHREEAPIDLNRDP